MSDLLLSVVIPTYNRRESLQATLAGLEKQRLPRNLWEVLVVSDGATDDTDAFLTGYAPDAPFTLRPLFQKNAGPARARNHGIREAMGEIVVFIDDDVEPAPHFLAAHWAHHNPSKPPANQTQTVVIGPLSPDPAREKTEPLWIAWEHAMLQKQYDAFASGQWASAGPNHFYSGNASVPRALLQAVGGFDETFTRQEDVEMACRMERLGNVSFVFEPKALGLHRPVRSLQSWLNVPFAYGGLDVIRARRGDTDWKTVSHGWTARSRPTQAVSLLALLAPFLWPAIQAALMGGAGMVQKVGRKKAALSALSVVQNVRYLKGANKELGSTGDLLRLAWKDIAPPASHNDTEITIPPAPLRRSKNPTKL